MSPTNLRLQNRHTGEVLDIWREKRRGELSYKLRGTLPAHRQGPPLHIHRAEDEEGLIVAGTLSAEVAGKLRADSRVASVVPDAIGSVADWPADAPPDDQYYAASQKDLPLIGMPAAYTRGGTGAGAMVAIMDTGVEYGHVFTTPRVTNATCTAPWPPRVSRSAWAMSRTSRGAPT